MSELVEERNTALVAGLQGHSPWASTRGPEKKLCGPTPEPTKFAKVAVGSPVNKTEKLGPAKQLPILKQKGVVLGRKDFPRRLTWEEEQYKREKGLCFRCPEKFFPGHKCKNAQLQLLLASKDGEVEEFMDTSEELAAVDEGGDASLTLEMNSMLGLSSHQTMMVKGWIKGRAVVVLIDSGASHNFLSLALVDELGIPVDQSHQFGVQIGNGKCVRGKGICREVCLVVQNHRIINDFHPFPLGCAEVILGMAWLCTLGVVISDYRRLTMQFQWFGETMKLVGDPSLSKELVSLKSLIKSMKHSEVAYLLEMTEAREEEEDIPEDFQTLIQSFPEVFKLELELPPVRHCDHVIHLKEGANPPRIRPYRYPHHQKNEIERMVKDMLKAGVI